MAHPARFSRPSPGGRRLALQRKFRLCVGEYGGAVSILTLTAPGADLLPWDDDLCTIEGPHKHSGENGCRVEWIYAYVWNATYAKRRQRIWEAAQRSADRYVRRMWGGKLPRQVGHARNVIQLRGVAHDHWVMPQASEVERAWSRHVRDWMKRQAEREAALGPAVVWEAVEREFRTGEVTPGVYGFGFSHPGRGAQSQERAADYAARNAAGYVSGQASGHYCRGELVQRTGATMRALRACNWLHVRRRLIENGELWDSVIPGHWSGEFAAQVLELEALCASLGAQSP